MPISDIPQELTLDRTHLPEWTSSPFDTVQSLSSQSSPLKRKYDSQLINTERIIPVSSDPLSALLQLANQSTSRPLIFQSVEDVTSSIRSSPRQSLTLVPRASWPQTGEPLVFGRSSKVCNHAIPTSRLISRQHVRATFYRNSHPKSPFFSLVDDDDRFCCGHVKIECLGWNGVTVHSNTKLRGLKKGKSLVVDDLGHDILLDMAGAKVIIPWPMVDGEGNSTERSLTPLTEDEVENPDWCQSRVNGETRSSLPSSPPPPVRHSPMPDISKQCLASWSVPPSSPLPTRSNSASFNRNRRTPERHVTPEFSRSSAPLFSVGLDDLYSEMPFAQESSPPPPPSSEGDIVTDPIDLPLPSSSRAQSPSPSLSSVGDEDEDDDLSDLAEDEDGDYGLPRDVFNSVLDNIPDLDDTGLEDERIYPQELPPRPRKQIRVNPPQVEVGDDEHTVADIAPPISISLKSPEWPEIDESPIRNHAINQLAFGRMKSMPPSALFLNLPSELQHPPTIGPSTSSETPSSVVPQLSLEQFLFIIQHTPCVGQIVRQGKDAAGKLLQNEYYYIPDQDDNEARKEAVQETGRGRTLRGVRKTHKQYFWKKPRI